MFYLKHGSWKNVPALQAPDENGQIKVSDGTELVKNYENKSLPVE